MSGSADPGSGSSTPVSFPAIASSGAGGGGGAGGGYGARGGAAGAASPIRSSIVPSPSEQLEALKASVHISRRPAPPVVNGVTPYLDVMTISSAQFPATIDGGKNQEEHTRLLMEPIAVPNLDHTGVFVRGTEKKVPLFYPTGKKNCNFRDTIRGRVRTVARTGVLTPDVAQQDALADSIRDAVKEQLAMRHTAKQRRQLRSSKSAPSTAARTRELTRMMRGEQAMTPALSTGLLQARGGHRSSKSAHRRRRKRRGNGNRDTTSASGARSVTSRATSRSGRSGMSRRSGRSGRPRSPGSVASGVSAFSSASRRSARSGMSRVRAIDLETRMLLRSLSETNEAMTRALTRA